jgi:stage V sporulation protein R
MDYSIDQLTTWDEKIVEIAKKHGLDWYDISYELVDYHSMIGHMAYHGLPTHFDHWSYGKAFESTMNRYNFGMEGLPFEMIINSDPSIAYLMRENPLYLQVLIMAHCVGHSDFFKNNRMFKNTRAETVVPRFRAAKKRIQGYIEDPNIGIDEVEKIIDSCHAVQFQTTKYGQIRRTYAEVKAEYVELLNEQKGKKPGTFVPLKVDINKLPLEPDYDILGFITEHGKMPQWKRDIIEVCRDEGQYFWPQIQTKVMNEGWASYWHYTLCHELNLPDEMHIPFIKMHNQVVRPHIGAINPYHLGFHLFQKIKERYGIEECFLARESCHDAAFLRQYLTEEDCVELNLFTFSTKKRGEVTVDDVSDDIGWEDVKAQLVKSVGGGSIPAVYVDEAKPNGTLIVKHEHDGRDLELSHANQVVEHLKHLWGSEVKFFTVIEDEPWEI